ncbi:MAG: rhomboid family intramembrane serine protease [Cytophagaceae bacterium]
MAFGFAPKYTQEFLLNNRSTEYFMVLALEAARELKWNIGYTSQSEFIAYTKLWMDSDGEEVSVKIQEEKVIFQSKSRGTQFGGVGKNKVNIEKLLIKIRKLEVSLSPETMAAKAEELSKMPVSREADLTSKPLLAEDKITNVFSVFIPTQGYFITPIMINLNILVFLLMTITGVNIIDPDSESLLKWGANFRPMTLDGEWWRILTCCFLHIGILHLAMNMYALVSIGLILEPHVGKVKFCVAYLLTGITASMASLWWHDLTISAGASGAIFGMYGVFLSLLTTNLINKTERQELLTSILVFVGYNLFNGLRGGIDNAAHIGGLLGGIIIGYAYLPALKKPVDLKLKWLTVGVLIILILGGSCIVYKSLPKSSPDNIHNDSTSPESLIHEPNRSLSCYTDLKA